MKNDYIEQAKKYILKFFEEEYQMDTTNYKFGKLNKINLMYTEFDKDYCDEFEDLNIEDDYLSLQVYVDLISLKIMIEYNNKRVYEEHYTYIEDFLRTLEHLDFDSYTRLDNLEEYIKGTIEVSIVERKEV